MSLDITNSLKGALGELYYKEGCDQRGWGYISLENINNAARSSVSFKDNHVLVFKKGFHRIPVKISIDLIREIMDTSKPTNNSEENPSFVFDFLACKVGQRGTYSGIVNADASSLCWVEIKTGGGGLSDNQVAALGKIMLKLAIFYIEDVLAPPTRIEIEWDIRTGKDWLNSLDEFEDGEDDSNDQDYRKRSSYYY